ncbi:MAG: hypothetical protein NZ518_09035, partial [Dehalococcoidia bacterium]|nr:hypothetical protein [Dehalococcoidia bacterium]
RYSVEFFEDSLGPARQEVRKRLSDAQETLGRHHDAWVQIWLIDDLLRQGHVDPALRPYRAQQLARANALESEFAAIWPTIAGVEFRALLGSALAATPTGGGER